MNSCASDKRETTSIGKDSQNPKKEVKKKKPHNIDYKKPQILKPPKHQHKY